MEFFGLINIGNFVLDWVEIKFGNTLALLSAQFNLF